jgi:hypothetical protein
MHTFLDRLGPNDRVLLVGDVRQHEAVDAGRPLTPRQVASAAPAIFLLVVSERGSEAEGDPVGDVFTYRGANFD